MFFFFFFFFFFFSLSDSILITEIFTYGSRTDYHYLYFSPAEFANITKMVLWILVLCAVSNVLCSPPSVNSIQDGSVGIEDFQPQQIHIAIGGNRTVIIC